MAITGTSVAAAVAFKDLQLNVTSATGFAVGNVIRVDNEFMVQTGAAVGTFIPVRRGAEGTAVVAHAILANCITGLPSDFPTLQPGRLVQIVPDSDPDMVTIGANGVIAVPVRDTIVTITKATALSATTLAAPSLAANGVRLTITSQTAAAHVITATTLLADAVSGSPHTTATYAAFKGATLSLEANAGLWQVIGSVGVTIT